MKTDVNEKARLCKSTKVKIFGPSQRNFFRIYLKSHAICIDQKSSIAFSCNIKLTKPIFLPQTIPKFASLNIRWSSVDQEKKNRKLITQFRISKYHCLSIHSFRTTIFIILSKLMQSNK